MRSTYALLICVGGLLIGSVTAGVSGVVMLSIAGAHVVRL